MKICYMGGGNLGAMCLQHLLDRGYEVSYALGDEFIKGVCYKQDIGVVALNGLVYQDDTDLIISVQYPYILKKEHISKASRAINLHMAPLPEYRGCNQFSYAIINKDNSFGTTVHELTERVDEGMILAEMRFGIAGRIWVKDLYNLTAKKSYQMFKAAIGKIIDGSVKGKVPVGKGSYHYRKEINELKKIDLSWPKEKIERYIRATYFPPFEPPYAEVAGKKVYFTFEP